MRPLDLPSDDFAKVPWSYPGAQAATSGLLVEDEYLRLQASAGRGAGHCQVVEGDASLCGRLDDVLLRSNVAAADRRTWVVAVGSNASPAVMSRKFSRAGVSTVVPLLKGTASGLAVGHSAHISRYGYVPAAPFHEPGVATPVVVSLLDTSQLRALDRTEPNYLRARLSDRQIGLEVESGERPKTFCVYGSRWGLLQGAGAGPLRMTTQRDVFAHLLALSRALGTYAAGERLEPLMRRLSRDSRQREQLSETFVTEDLVIDSGLT